MTTSVRMRTESIANPVAGWSAGAAARPAACLVLAGVLWVCAELIGFGLDGDAQMRFLASQPVLAGVGITCDILAVPFLTGGVLAWYMMARLRSPRLALTGAIALAFGLTGQSVVNGVEVSMYQIMNSGSVSAATLTEALGAGPGPSVLGITLMIIFNGGALIGIILLMIAVWRSHAVPRTAVALVIAFQVMTILPLPFPSTIVAAVGLIWMAAAIVLAQRRSAPKPAA